MSSVTVVFVNQKSEIRRVGEVAERFGADQGLAEDDVMAVNLVLDELVANIIENGYDDTAEHQIHVTLGLEGRELTILVEDDGRPFDPTAAPPPDLDLPLEDRPVGGLGIHIVRTVMDSVQYERRGDRNMLTMHKTLARN